MALTFKQFLEEDRLTTMQDNELKDLLQHDCAFFLQESKRKGFLIRGMHTLSSRGTRKSLPHPRDPEFEGVQFWEREVRQDRAPTDTSLKTHRMLDHWFENTFGIKARSQALFCMGSSGSGVRSTKQYGDTYIIMPIGEFKYVWSPKVTDLYGETSGIQWNRDYEDEAREVDPEEMVNKFMTNRDYTDKNLNLAVQGRFEIMVGCRKYYAFEYEHRPLLETILDIA